MKKSLLVLQFVLTLFILAFIKENALKVLLLLPVWWLAFGGLTRNELISYFVINLIFIVSDIGAIQNSFFKFTHPDVFGLPYWEFFMWGFYLLHTHRMFPAKVPKERDFKLLLLAIVFSQLFGVISDRNLLLISTSSVLLITLFFYHRKDDLLYCIYLMCMGAATEYVGLTFNLWSYPDQDYSTALVQFVVMWGATGIYFRHVAGGWLIPKKVWLSVNKESHELLSPQLQSDFEIACQFKKEKKFVDADCIFSKIESFARVNSIPLNYRFYIQYSELCIIDGNLRKAAELSREALPTATVAYERAYLYLQLCRIYRMMILMKNARLELHRAFAEMKIEAPRDSFAQAIGTIFFYFWAKIKNIKIVTDESVRKSLQIEVALYEEAGLSAYYFLEPRMLLQSTLKSRKPAFQLGESIQMMNWLGGSGCVWAVLGWKSRAEKLISRALEVAKKIQAPYAIHKSHLWNALMLGYLGRPKDSASEFEGIVREKSIEESPYDLRLSATTLSCNYLIRGHMQAAESCIREMTNKEIPRSRYFSCGKAFVDWYRLPALGFLGETEEAELVLRNSQIVFNRVDEEKWQITQFLGGLLIYYYSKREKNIADIRNCLHRFEALSLSPRWTYLEAAQIWAAKAHLFIDLHLEGHLSLKEAKLAVRQLGQVPSHPVIYNHLLIAKAKLGWIEKKSNAKKWDEMSLQADKLANEQDNLWVQYEVLKYNLIKTQNTPASKESHERLHEFCHQKSWKGMLR